MAVPRACCTQARCRRSGCPASIRSRPSGDSISLARTSTHLATNVGSSFIFSCIPKRQSNGCSMAGSKVALPGSALFWRPHVASHLPAYLELASACTLSYDPHPHA